MARNRRDRGDNPNDILSDLENVEASTPFDGLTASDIADAAYGSGVGHDDPFAKLGRNKQKIHMTLIDAIVPNATQPRRAIPSSIRQYWSGLSDEESMAHFFQKWLEEVNLERRDANIKDSFPLDDYLAGDATSRTKGIEDESQLDQIDSQRVGAKEEAFLRVVELAASIKRDGLINPITIVQNGRLWEIETGERRWLAYQLLNWRFGGEDWAKIPAQKVEQIDIWRQATENNARADLNAIAKARQFAILLMDLVSEGKDFKSFTEFEHEQDYYAQVSDGNVYRVPRSRGEDILNAMGLENPVQIRQYRSLLRLPQPVWEWADDLNWTESFIRKEIIAQASDDEDMIRHGVKYAIAEGYTVSSVTVYEHLLEDKSSTKAKRQKLSFSDVQNTTLAKLESQLSKLGKADRNRVVDYLEHLLEELKQSE